MIYLKRNREYGGFVQGVQTQLMDGTNNWWWGNIHEDHWMVSKGAYNNMKFVIKSNGNVGIGTTDPGAKLEISADTENQLRINGTRTDGDFSGIWLEGLWSNSNEAVFGIVGTNDHSSDILDDKFRFQIKDENGLWRRPIMFESNGDVQFNAIGGSSGTMTIKEDGNVGIGTTDPEVKLEVTGHIGLTPGAMRALYVLPASATTDGDDLKFGAGNAGTGDQSGGDVWLYGGAKSGTGSNGNVILAHDGTNTGNVGIGTVDPGAKVHIENLAVSTRALRVDNSLGNEIVNIFEDSNSDASLYLKDSNAVTNIRISAGTSSTYFNGGNVGIGTTDPLSPFHVNIATNQNIRFRSESSEAEIMVANDVGTLTPLRMKASEFNFNNGNVGIGTTSPTQTLSISGAMNITPSASPPENPSAGTIYVDSSSAVCVYIGGGWTSIAGAGTCD